MVIPGHSRFFYDGNFSFKQFDALKSIAFNHDPIDPLKSIEAFPRDSNAPVPLSPGEVHDQLANLINSGSQLLEEIPRPQFTRFDIENIDFP